MKPLFFLLFFSVFSFAQQTETVDYKNIDASLEVFPENKTVEGRLTAGFTILRNTDSIYLDAKAMEVSLSSTSQTNIRLKTQEDKIWMYFPFKANNTYSVSFDYRAEPKQAIYFFENQVWTQGQGKETSHWLPSIDDVNDKITFSLSITAAKQYTVLANGQLEKQEEKPPEKKMWAYSMQKPMSSYLVALALGNFNKQTEKTKTGIPLEYYYTPENEDKVEPTYRYTNQLFDFLETEIGVPYPWENYKQVPVRDFLYAGMENTTLTIFSEAFVVDSTGFIDRNYVNVNAHELAHQWFGNLVTATNSKHHWLQEGFATYYALLAEREIFGDNYFYWKLYQSTEQLMELSDTGEGEALLKEGASSLTYYQKGAWALHILKESIGELSFKQAVKNYIEKHQYKTVTTEDFLKEVEMVSGQNLDWFRQEWLQQSAFKASQALESLKKSTFIQNYLGLSAIANQPFSDKEPIFNRFLEQPVNDYLGQAVVYQLVDVPFGESRPLYEKAFESNNVLVRQAIAQSLEKIPTALKSNFETLLQDDSYVTIEAAIYHLWINFPEDRNTYLDKTEGIGGFQDKNVRLLWLALAIVTDGYQNDKKSLFFKELSQYSKPEYSFEIRQGAFQFLFGLDGFTKENLKNLVDACLHHNWRFAKSSRELLEALMQDPETKSLLLEILPELPEKQSEWLRGRL
ncbi:MAG: M1 family metallopeptidase [Flavobacteriaceae bacterium]